MRRETLLHVLALALVLGVAGQVAAKTDISKDTYDALAKIHKLIENQDYGEASARLDALGNAKASHYEQALMLQTRGHLLARIGQHEEAVAALKASLAQKALPGSASQGARYLLIQVLAAEARWAEAAAEMDAWLANERRPSAQAQALAGAIFARVERPEQAAVRLAAAIEQSKDPQELWYRQLAAVYLGEKQYDAASALLGDMVQRFPQRKEYWLQLSGVNQAVGDDLAALAVMELAYERRLPFDEGELVRLARLRMHLGQPQKAGDLLERALGAGSLSPSPEHLTLLASAWVSAREIVKALRATERVLKVAPGAELQLRRAELAAEIEDWRIVHDAAGAALDFGGLQRPEAAYLLRGIACYHLDRRSDAVVAFEQARLLDPSNVQVEQWIQFLTAAEPVGNDGPFDDSALASGSKSVEG